MLGWEEGEDVYVLLIEQLGQCPTATHITIPSGWVVSGKMVKSGYSWDSCDKLQQKSILQIGLEITPCESTRFTRALSAPASLP